MRIHYVAGNCSHDLALVRIHYVDNAARANLSHVNIHSVIGTGGDMPDNWAGEGSPLRYPVNVLISYHYFKESNVAEIQGWGLRIIGDSGAYSADSQGVVIDVDSFAEWIVRWRANLHWVASLDVIGDQTGSWDNWLALRSMGLETVPTIHYGDDPRALDRYVERGVDFMGLGGMVPYKSEPKRLLRWCLSVMRYARDNHPHLRFHGWGVTHPDLVMNLPWWSVDSSGFSASYRYGRASLFDPRTGKKIAVQLDGREVAKHARLLRDVYGVDWRDVAVSTSETRRAVVRMSFRSAQLLEDYLSRRHRVTPPASLGEPEQGPTISLPLGFPDAQPAKTLRELAAEGNTP